MIKEIEKIHHMIDFVRNLSYYKLFFFLVVSGWGEEQTFAIWTNIYLFKVNNRDTNKSCEICSKLTIKTPERRHWYFFSSIFVGDIEQVHVW